MASRDLNAAKDAFSNADVAASRAAHDAHGEAGHAGEAGKYVKSLVFGGLDGTITTFAVVAASKGGSLSADVVLLMGFANLVADGLSMGFGDYLSSKAELEFVKTEKKREKWELENYPEGEKKEMIELYMARGVSEDDATLVIETLAKYKNFFLDLMLVEELGLMPPDETDSPAKNGLVTFVAFAMFGFVPLVPYVFGKAIGGANGNAMFGSACGLTALTMAALGAAKAKFTNQNMTSSALYMLLNGSLAAASAYLVSFAISKALNVDV
jgi:VIT1/CCC1 family predicted Fe2+/Mn2+ transporter